MKKGMKVIVLEHKELNPQSWYKTFTIIGVQELPGKKVYWLYDEFACGYMILEDKYVALLS